MSYYEKQLKKYNLISNTKKTINYISIFFIFFIFILLADKIVDTDQFTTYLIINTFFDILIKFNLWIVFIVPFLIFNGLFYFIEKPLNIIGISLNTDISKEELENIIKEEDIDSSLLEDFYRIDNTLFNNQKVRFANKNENSNSYKKYLKLVKYNQSHYDFKTIEKLVNKNKLIKFYKNS